MNTKRLEKLEKVIQPEVQETKTLEELLAECKALPEYLQMQVIEAYRAFTGDEGALALAEALNPAV